MPTRTIKLTDQFDRFIDAEVKSGRYCDASEVVRESLRLMQRCSKEERAKLQWLRGAVKDGLDQIERGEGLEFDTVRELEQHIDRLSKEAAEAPPHRKRA